MPDHVECDNRRVEDAFQILDFGHSCSGRWRSVAVPRLTSVFRDGTGNRVIEALFEQPKIISPYLPLSSSASSVIAWQTSP